MDNDGLTRLEMTFLVNPEWAAQVSAFVADNPVFLPFVKYTSWTPRANIPDDLKTVKDMLLYYASHAGVKADYGGKVFDWVREGQLDKLTAKKRETIDRILELDEIVSREQFDKVVIKGIGEGARCFVLEHYFNDVNIAYPSDRVFQRGLAKIYGLPKNPTVSQCKNIIKQWKGNLSVGSSFCFQAAHYHN